jgi:hypothetical protein
MIDESILKSNFLGRDGFRWWIGQIPPTSSQSDQANGAGWGNRCKVRILGYHPYSEVELPNEDLPWAQVMVPTTAGTGAANYATNTKLQQGDVVFGFFLDGDNAQLPVIIGCFGRTDKVSSEQFATPFSPFTGYTDNIKKPSGTLKAEESNQQNAGSQKSPRSVSPSTAAKINSQTPGSEEISYFSGIGQKIIFGNSCEDTAIKGISTEVTNLLSKVQNSSSVFSNISNEIDRTVETITGLANGIVGQMFYKVYNSLVDPLQQGLDILYKTVFAKVFAATQERSIAHEAGVKAQEAMVAPTKKLEQAIPCVSSNITNGLSGVIKDILKSVIDNVKNFVTCAGEQFVGALANTIIGAITSGLAGPLSGVSKLLSFAGGFDLNGILRGGIDSLAGIAGFFGCNQSRSKCSSGVNQWTIGCSGNDTGSEKEKFGKILANANIAATIGNAVNAAGDVVSSVQSGFDIFSSATSLLNAPLSPLGGCYTGDLTGCGAPQVKIFGGGGSGASATSILGNFVTGIVDGSDLTTASVIGVRVDNTGSGYRYPPFVEIVDDCNQGYGAVARSVINENGEVVAIYIVSEGENYSIDPEPNLDYTVGEVVIEDPGFDYDPNDDGVDNFGNRYQLTVDNGRIIKVAPINRFVVSSLPEITINSQNGRGAVLRPIISVTPPPQQGEVVQVIDCIT